MELSQDLWGEICKSYNPNKNQTYSIVRDDGKIRTEQIKNYFNDDILPYEQKALECLYGTVLDVGCGPGRSLRYLSKKNIRCIGVDSSLGVVELARQRSRCKVIQGDLHNILDFKGEGLDGILLNGNNLGLSGDLEKFEVFISHAYQILRPDGIFVGHSINPHITSDSRNLDYQKNNIKNGIYLGQIRIHLEYMNKKTPMWNLLLLDPVDSERVLRNTGFSKIKFITNGPYYYIIAAKD